MAHPSGAERPIAAHVGNVGKSASDDRSALRVTRRKIWKDPARSGRNPLLLALPKRAHLPRASPWHCDGQAEALSSDCASQARCRIFQNRRVIERVSQCKADSVVPQMLHERQKLADFLRINLGR